MGTQTAELKVWVSGRAGLRWRIGDLQDHILRVGDQIDSMTVQDVGLAGGKLMERHIAFLALVILDRQRELGAGVVAGKIRPQRERFADYLGLSMPTFRKWLERNLARQPGSILKWDWLDFKGHEPSRTGGPWWFVVRHPVVYPDPKRALEFIDRQRRMAIIRREDPDVLLCEAMHQRDQGEWDEALLILGQGLEMFRRRRWSRKSALYFKIYLTFAEVEMQLGAAGLRPSTAFNIMRSVSKQSSFGTEGKVIRAKAHHVAALVWNQWNDEKAAEATVRELKKAQEALVGDRRGVAVQELWKIRSYQEVSEARATGLAVPKERSAILQAGRVVEGTLEESRMRYGESLLCANRQTDAIEYIQPALHSGHLTKPAWVVAERLQASAEWEAGARSGTTMEALERLEKRAEALGFMHQIREIRYRKKLVRRGIRTSLYQIKKRKLMD